METRPDPTRFKINIPKYHPLHQFSLFSHASHSLSFTLRRSRSAVISVHRTPTTRFVSFILSPSLSLCLSQSVSKPRRLRARLSSSTVIIPSLFLSKRTWLRLSAIAQPDPFLSLSLSLWVSVSGSPVYLSLALIFFFFWGRLFFMN